MRYPPWSFQEADIDWPKVSLSRWAVRTTLPKPHSAASLFSEPDSSFRRLLSAVIGNWTLPAAAGDGMVAPRTWGHPEIYGARAYAVFLYGYHAACAPLVRASVEAVHGIAPGMRVFRNATRGAAWSYLNDHDGGGQELLTRELDLVHLDPYPVSDKYADWRAGRKLGPVLNVRF